MGTQLADRVPVGRAGHADDIVRTILFFASPAADFVTGQVLSIAGGGRRGGPRYSPKYSAVKASSAQLGWRQASCGRPALRQV